MLTRSQSLLVDPKAAYLLPRDQWHTSTTVWRTDELIRRQVRDWKRLMGEDGHTGTRAEVFRADHDSVYTATHSVFPAPLVEWALHRYSRPGFTVLDAFAGGPPRAVVTAFMGMKYTGFDIRQEQIDENLKLLKRLKLDAEFVCGDGCYMDGVPDGHFQFGITCPPYHDLERYSDLPQDLSNQRSYGEFRAGMALCAEAYFRKMCAGAFVAMAVGPFRDKRGELVDFPGHVVTDFREVGFLYWQNIVITKNFGSAAKRASNAWRGLKLVPCHEFLLIFRKPE